MTETTLLPSTHERQSPPAWPANAVPKHWIDSLFSKMSAFYGARFADAWRDTDLAQVQKTWGVELRKLSAEELKVGVAALIHRKFPPTLPEFYALCKEERAGQAQATLAIENGRRASQSIVEENVAKIRAMLSGAMTKTPTAEWAFKLLQRGTSLSGKPLTASVTDCALRAIRSPAGRSFFRDASEAQKAMYRNIFEIATQGETVSDTGYAEEQA